ncbi:hypothetical protein CPC08DRAFT_500721 [Agrocybe pediades]|nr:hypothetical protein CPC08DRAFT_500721 [Agrocybe pediades]
MAYNYYQNTMPSYGSNQPFQFGAPPKPAFQPQPSWGGHDFYRAHAANADPYLFDHAWNRVREYGGAPAGGMGVGLHEARHWHRRAYGAMNEVHLLAPEELGHAAAYEAYRTWIHNSFMYEPLSGDIERQREALTGLAVAEASRLLTFSSRPLDNYAKMAASEAAAHTASYIFYQRIQGPGPVIVQNMTIHMPTTMMFFISTHDPTPVPGIVLIQGPGRTHDIEVTRSQE